LLTVCGEAFVLCFVITSDHFSLIRMCNSHSTQPRLEGIVHTIVCRTRYWNTGVLEYWISITMHLSWRLEVRLHSMSFPMVPIVLVPRKGRRNRNTCSFTDSDPSFCVVWCREHKIYDCFGRHAAVNVTPTKRKTLIIAAMPLHWSDAYS
jgi:hypothetical protein